MALTDWRVPFYLHDLGQPELAAELHLPARFVAFGIHRPHIESPALAIPVEQPTANVLVEEVPAWT